MPQVQAKQFPGFGIVYPDGVSGIKIVHTFTEGPLKIINPDGSVSYTTPAPTIHELFGGGFAYSSGRPVTDRKHLEMLPAEMREKALKWFDGHGELSAVAKENVPPLNLDEKERPEPVYVLSTDLPTSTDEVTKELDKIVKGESIEILNTLGSISQSLSVLSKIVEEQGKQITELTGTKPEPKVSRQSEIMKARWADPEWRARRKKKGNNGKDAT